MILREMRDLIKYHTRNTHRFAEHDCRNVFEKAVKDLKSAGFDSLEGKTALDLGCGQRFPFALQCAVSGAIVAALDLDYVKPDPLFLAFVRIVKRNGLKRASKSLLRRLLFDRTYYEALETAASKPLREYHAGINFILADPQMKKYPLPDDSFDLIATNAVIEHVDNVSLFASEIRRLLHGGSYFYGIIHNFYSLSGGHNLEWAFPDEKPSDKVPPWDHLRDNQFPALVYLNRLFPEEYEKAFSEHLDILLFEGRDIKHDPGGIEGEQFLTPEIASGLAAYPRDLLLTRSWCIICRKTQNK